MAQFRIFARWSVLFMLCAAPLQAQSLVHRWAFENDYNDTSGSGNHGTATGAPTFVSGRFGQGVSIVSPNDGVNVDFLANNLPLQATDNWSMNLWAKFDTPPEDLEYLAGFGIDDGFVGSLDTGGARAFLSFAGPTNNNFYFWGGGRDVNSGVGYDVDGEWHMYTITYNGTTMDMYKDGVSVLATTPTVVLNDALDEIHVGNPSNWNSDFDGSLDEFAIFNGALSESQVGGLFFNNDINQPEVIDPSFTVDRDTGELIFNNDSSFGVNILGYTVRSASGSLNPVAWETIAGRFDAPPGGDGTVDPNDVWTVLTDTDLSYSIELSEGVPGTDGATIPIGKVINLGASWVANPNEDLVIDLLLDDDEGTIKTIPAEFFGNGNEAFALGDLDADGGIDIADWQVFRSATVADLTGKTVTEAYLGGDLDGDFDKDIDDYSLFVASFDAALGAGAFARATAAVPEPSTALLLGLGLLALSGVQARRRLVGPLCAIALAACLSGQASAALWGYYPLSGDANEATGNNIDLNVMGDTKFRGSVHPGLGGSISLDGVGDGAIGENFNQFQTNDVTVVAWARADSLAGDWNTIVKNWGSSVGGQFHLGLGSVADDTLQNFIADGTSVATATVFPESEWVHTAFVLDSVAMEHRLYMNGEVVATGSYAGTLGAGTATGLGIGHKPNDDGTALDGGGGAGGWNGRIDDVGLYNEVLSAVQIEEIYQNGLAGVQLDGTTASYISLQVDRTSGNVKLRNPTAGAISFNAYEISSAAGSLKPADWQDLAGNTGFPAGDGTGNGWEKDQASNQHQLLETFLTDDSALAAGAEISLGNVFGGAEDLALRYRTANGIVIDSIVDYIGAAPSLFGDYNSNGIVDAADYTVWRDKLGQPFALPNEDPSATPGQVTADDYNVWKSNFGASSGSASMSGVAGVPEPHSLGLLAAAAMAVVGWRFRRPTDIPQQPEWTARRPC